MPLLLAEEANAEESVNGNVKQPKKRRESGMLKQVKRELAEELAAKKAEAAAKSSTGTGDSVKQDGQPKKPKKPRANKASAAFLTEEDGSGQLHNGQPKSKKETVATGASVIKKIGAGNKQKNIKSRHLKKRK